MLKFRYKRITESEATDAARSVTTTSVADTNPDLRIRNLLDDPALRRAMHLDLELALVRARPDRPFNQRRLLEQAAA